MTLIFSKNDYKYEIEGVMKLFIPAQKFKLIYDDNYTPKDELASQQALICQEVQKEKIILTVKVNYNERLCLKSKEISLDQKENGEFILSKLLYQAMAEITEIHPKWGVITGVRPVKRVNAFIDKGLSKEEIVTQLHEEFLCTKEKSLLAYETAIVQKPFLKELSPDFFSLYISIPFCPSRCSYCSFVCQSIESCMGQIPEYIENLSKEIFCLGEIANKLGLKLETVYFGGGTPTSLTPEQLFKIINAIENSFDTSYVKEYTIEAGRPDTIDEQKLRTIKSSKCTRISINPQTLNDQTLINIGRKHTVKQFLDSFALARNLGFNLINTDIIAGLPLDSLESFINTVDGILKLSPENITVHTLSIKRAAKLNREEKSMLSSDAEKMMEYASKRLIEEGYKPYYLYRQKNMLDNLENIGWTKCGCESLYNIYIMEEVQTILAAGAGGSTKLVDLKNHRMERIFNYKFPLEYNKNFQLMLERKKRIEKFYAEEK